ncbi:hypothetical protein MIMGU_mgv1a024331mg, partial [Erythranthe guttata]
KRRRRTSTIEFRNEQRRLLTNIPSQEPARRLSQIRYLAMALTSLNFEYINKLTYSPSMAPCSAYPSSFENAGIEALYRIGELPHLVVAFNSLEGYLIFYFVLLLYDYIINLEQDDCDSMMTLLSSADPSKSLVACADRLGNISRVISGINNHTTKKYVKCVRYNVDKECVVLLVANRDIAKGERLYYDYNGCEHEYSTHSFV